jgi:hypothetical protein
MKDQKIVIQKKTPATRWSVWEYCLLSYIERTEDADGTFQQTSAKIAETIQAEERAIQLHLRDLTAKSYLIEVHPRYRGVTGWWVPAIYRRNPASFGTGGLLKKGLTND